MTQYCFLASTPTAVTSDMSTLPSERKKLVWQSWWQVRSFLSVTTRQHGIQGVGATPWGMTCRRNCCRLWTAYTGVGFAITTDHPYSFRDGLTQQLHPLSHILLIVGTEFQRRSLCQDHLEGMRTLRAVWPTAAPAVLPSGKKVQKCAGSGSITITGDIFSKSQNIWTKSIRLNLPHTDWQQRCNICSLSVQVQNSTATRKMEKQLRKYLHPPTLQLRLHKSTC